MNGLFLSFFDLFLVVVGVNVLFVDDFFAAHFFEEFVFCPGCPAKPADEDIENAANDEVDFEDFHAFQEDFVRLFAGEMVLFPIEIVVDNGSVAVFSLCWE